MDRRDHPSENLPRNDDLKTNFQIIYEDMNDQFVVELHEGDLPSRIFINESSNPNLEDSTSVRDELHISHPAIRSPLRPYGQLPLAAFFLVIWPDCRPFGFFHPATSPKK